MLRVWLSVRCRWMAEGNRVSRLRAQLLDIFPALDLTDRARSCC